MCVQECVCLYVVWVCVYTLPLFNVCVCFCVCVCVWVQMDQMDVSDFVWLCSELFISTCVCVHLNFHACVCVCVCVVCVCMWVCVRQWQRECEADRFHHLADPQARLDSLLWRILFLVVSSCDSVASKTMVNNIWDVYHTAARSHDTTLKLHFNLGDEH